MRRAAESRAMVESPRTCPARSWSCRRTHSRRLMIRPTESCSARIAVASWVWAATSASLAVVLGSLSTVSGWFSVVSPTVTRTV